MKSEDDLRINNSKIPKCPYIKVFFDKILVITNPYNISWISNLRPTENDEQDVPVKEYISQIHFRIKPSPKSLLYNIPSNMDILYTPPSTITNDYFRRYNMIYHYITI